MFTRVFSKKARSKAGATIILAKEHFLKEFGIMIKNNRDSLPCLMEIFSLEVLEIMKGMKVFTIIKMGIFIKVNGKMI